MKQILHVFYDKIQRVSWTIQEKDTLYLLTDKNNARLRCIRLY